jgi:IS5 family transposase
MHGRRFRTANVIDDCNRDGLCILVSISLWTKKRGETYCGYKDHINVDAEHKLIRKYIVTSCNAPDMHCMEE